MDQTRASEAAAFSAAPNPIFPEMPCADCGGMATVEVQRDIKRRRVIVVAWCNHGRADAGETETWTAPVGSVPVATIDPNGPAILRHFGAEAVFADPRPFRRVGEAEVRRGEPPRTDAVSKREMAAIALLHVDGSGSTDGSVEREARTRVDELLADPGSARTPGERTAVDLLVAGGLLSKEKARMRVLRVADLIAALSSLPPDAVLVTGDASGWRVLHEVSEMRLNPDRGERPRAGRYVAPKDGEGVGAVVCVAID